MRIQPVAFCYRCLLATSVGVGALSAFALSAHFPAFTILPISILSYRRLKQRGQGSAFGTARSTTYAELVADGLLGDDGLILGTAGYTPPPGLAEALAALVNPAISSDLACRMFFSGVLGSPLANQTMIRVRDYVHLATFARSGAGKGVSVLIPNAVAHWGNCVILDPQGSVYAATAAHRRKRFRQRVVCIDTSRLCGQDSDSLNPFDFIDPRSPDFLEQIRDLVTMLIPRKGTEPDEHWLDSAERVLVAFACFVCLCETNPDRRNLLTVRAIVNSRESYLATVNVMRQMKGIVKQQGESLTWLQDKELNSVLSVVQRCTAWMDSPNLAASIRTSSFDVRQLRQGRMSVYLIQRPDRLVTLAPHLRMMLGTIIRVITRGKADERNPVLFLIDEAAALGRMQVLEDAITQLRGFGIRLWLFYQSIGQLQECYGAKAQTILDNLGTQQFFSVSGYESTEYLSKLIGEMTIWVASDNDTRTQSHPTGSSAHPTPGSASTSSSVSYSQQSRRWAKAEEIRTLPSDLSLTFHNNSSVIQTQLIPYFKAREFQGGGTGRNRGLGVSGGILTTGVMLFSLLLAALLIDVTPPAWPHVSSRNSARGPSAAIRRPSYRYAPPRRRRSHPDIHTVLPSRSGFLIRIPDAPRPPAKPGGAAAKQGVPHAR